MRWNGLRLNRSGGSVESCQDSLERRQARRLELFAVHNKAVSANVKKSARRQTLGIGWTREKFVKSVDERSRRRM
jgi:hypothetical protein